MTTEAALLASAQARTQDLLAELDGILHLGFGCTWTKQIRENHHLAMNAAQVALNTSSARTAGQQNDTLKKALLDMATEWNLDTAYIEAV